MAFSTSARLPIFFLLCVLLFPGGARALEGWPFSSAETRAEEAAPKAVGNAPETPVQGQPPNLVIPSVQSAIPTIDLTAETDDLWQRVRNGFAMPNLSNELVTSQQAWILNRPDYLRRTLERGRRYLHYIVDELEKRGMPTELALLPMVESSYNPMAISPARASGLWQFIPSTGKTYGLKQDWWSDERRDVVASTNAALDYLQFLYDMQGDWHLALASYNWGEGSVQRAIAKNKAAGKPTDYMSLNMPAETRNYVPKLQALKNIISQPELFKVSLTPIPNRPYFKTVRTPAAMDMAMAAKLAETPLEEFRALNPSPNRPVLRSQGSASLVLPADKVDTFLNNYQESEKQLLTWGNHILRRKERLDQVAARYGISVAKLKQINSLGPNSRIAPGHVLLVPSGGEGTDPQEIGGGLTPPPEALTPPKVHPHNGRHGHHAAAHSPAKAPHPSHPSHSARNGAKAVKSSGKSASRATTPAKKKHH